MQSRMERLTSFLPPRFSSHVPATSSECASVVSKIARTASGGWPMPVTILHTLWQTRCLPSDHQVFRPIVASLKDNLSEECMDQRQHDMCAEGPRIECGWCGRALRESPNAQAHTSHGLCDRCARVLSGKSLPSADPVLPQIEEHTNRLMCRLYESRQSLLAIQRHVSDNAELLGVVGRVLSSVRQQERIVADIQQCILAAQK